MTLADLSPLANHLWQSTLCVAAAWLLTLALKKNRAAVRYWIWLAASVKFLIPFSLLVSIGSQLEWRTAPVAVQPQWTSVIDDVGVPFTVSAPVIQVSLPHASNPIPAILFCVWLCGFAVSVVFWLRCLRRVRAARRGAALLALDLPIRVMSSRSLIEPGIFGIFRPVLLLPEGITDCLDAAQLDAIFAHEMCHVRRRDNLTAAIHMVVETIFWFHPLVWWIRTRLVEERERACDEGVLNSGGDPRVYAEGILNVCKFYLESPLTCVSGVTGSDLKKRIVRIMTERLGADLTFARKLLLAVIVIVAVAGPLAFGLANAPLLRAQAATHDWQTAAGGKRAFEVASVKRNKVDPSGSPRHSNISFGASDVFTPTGGLLSASNIPLIQYMSFAYKLTASRAQAVNSQLPKWANTDRYDIQARAADSNPTKDQMRLMMQSLLADRFKLAIHYETRQLPVFALVLDKPGKLGPQLQPHSEDSPCSAAPPAEVAGPLPTVAGSFPLVCGGAYFLPSAPGRVRVGARDVAMEAIATSLIFSPNTSGIDRPVLDKTELTGKYDFAIEWAPELNGPQPSISTFQPDATGPTFLEAMKDQLGLKLVPQTGPVEILVIDHIEEPSGN